MLDTLPVMMLKGLLLLPNQEVKLELNNEFSRQVIMLSGKSYNKNVLVVCPKNQLEELPDVEDLPRVCVIGKIKNKIELPNGHLRITLIGQKRVHIKKYFNETKEKDILLCKYEEIEDNIIDSSVSLALRRKLINYLNKYIKSASNISNSIINATKDVMDLNILTDMISTFIPITFEKKLNYIEETNPLKRAEKLLEDLHTELEVIKLDNKIEESLQKELENSQKEFILKERIREIEKELGTENIHTTEVLDYTKKCNSLKMNKKTKEKIQYEIKKYDLTSDVSPDSSMIRGYLDWILNLPWNEETKEESDLLTIETLLNNTHYGLEKIKERIIEFVAVKQNNPDMTSPIICLVGPPGVGKTSIAQSISKSLKREFYKISVGGLNDSSELNGHRRTYIGANPGRIIQGLKKVGTKNPVILIDEVDKMVKDYKGDPASVLLDILDTEQNKYFIDNYIEEPFDLSKIFFILTANNISHIPIELRDRLEIIEVSSYTIFEKIDIAKKYLLPNILKEHGKNENDFKIKDSIYEIIINNYTREAGVRELSRNITTILRKIITESLKNKTACKKILNKKDLIKYLGEYKFIEENVTENMVPGLVYGLAYTPFGGLIVPVESCLYEGTGKTVYTGSLGKVMQESIDVSLSYIKSHQKQLKIAKDIFKTKDIHIHALEGAIEKDGPSAGVTITTSIISLILGKTIPCNVAMTGEMSLRGDILPIGGLKEKLIGAYNEKIKIVFIPQKNHSDLKEIPDFLKENIKIIEVENYSNIFLELFK